MIWIIKAAANAAGLAAAAWMFSGIWVVGHDTGREIVEVLVVGAILTAVNEFIRPLVALLSTCLYILTLGLMYFVVNALMLMLTSWISRQVGLGYRVEGFWTALFGAIVVGLVAWGTSLLLPDERELERRKRARARAR